MSRKRDGVRTASDRHLSLERRLDRILGPPLVLALSRIVRRRQAPQPASDPHHILLIKLHGIGNIVLILPALRLLRRRFPQAEIDFFSFTSNRGIIEDTPEISSTHFIDRTTLSTLVGTAARIVPALARARYDLVVDFDQFAHLSTLAALMTRAPVRIGFKNPSLSRHRAYTIPVSWVDIDHVSATFLRLAAHAAGLPTVPGIGEGERIIPLSACHRHEAAAFAAAEGIGLGDVLVLLHPGSSENLVIRRWPAERFAELGTRLAALPGVRIVVTGGPDEAGLVERVRAAIRPPAPATTGRLSLKGFAALCSRAELVVSNDTAAVHIAAAMGTPVAGIYGPNTPALYGPTGGSDLVFHHEFPCSPCITNLNAKFSSCLRPRCIDAVTVEEVFSAIRTTFFDADGRLLPAFVKDRGGNRG